MAQDSYGNPITNINNIALDYEFIGRYNGVQFYRITDTVNGTTYTVSIKNEQEYGITADRSSATAIEYMPDLSGIAEELTEAETNDWEELQIEYTTKNVDPYKHSQDRRKPK